MARRRFFVPAIRNQQAEIEGDDAHHLTRVLRVEVGQHFEISDGANVYLAEVTEARKSRVLFRVGDRVALRPLPVQITLYAALFKFDHFEWMLEKGTEAGVSAFVPVLCDRTEKGLDRAVEKRRQRWERILLEASQQCRRDSLPALEEMLRFDKAIVSPGDCRLVLEEEEGARPILDSLPEPERRMQGDKVALLVGPEGGWTAAERARFQQAQWTPVSLGPLILRAETACMAAAAIVSAAWQSKY